MLQTIAPEDHDRTKLIGGSDIAAILGISPWRTAMQVWQDKTTPRSERSEEPRKAVFKRGKRWESVVAEMIVEDLQQQGHTVEVIGSNRRFRDAEHPMFAAEIDLELLLDDEPEPVNVELKTVSHFAGREWGDTGSDDLPIQYTAQVMWGLGLTGRRRGILAALFGADELRSYPVAADADTIAALRMRALSFWNEHVVPRVPPAPANAADLLILYPRENDGPPLLADAELTGKVLRLRALTQQIGAAEAERDAIEYELKQAMRDASELILPNGKTPVEWKARKGTYLDETRLKAEHPAIAKQYAKQWQTRVFRLKAFDTKGL